MAKKKDPRPEVSFHDLVTGEVVVREMNDEEYSEYLEQLKKYEEQVIAKTEKQKRKEIAIAKFVELGITEDDLRAVGLNNDII